LISNDIYVNSNTTWYYWSHAVDIMNLPEHRYIKHFKPTMTDIIIISVIYDTINNITPPESPADNHEARAIEDDAGPAAAEPAAEPGEVPG
jgi:hypothetical protein